MVTNDVGHGGFFCGSFHGMEIEKSLIAFGVLWLLLFWQHIFKLYCQNGCVDHLVLGISRMNAYAVDGNLCGSRVKVLVLNLADYAAVHGIGPICSKVFVVKMIHPCSDFFIWSESNGDFTMWNLWMSQQILCHGHDFRNTGLVVRTQKSGAVCGHKGFSCKSCHFREVSDAKCCIGV